jgi:hypothetical protein
MLGHMSKDAWMVLSTGEVVDDSDIILEADRLRRPVRRRSPFGARWCKVSMVAVERIAELDLSALETRLLLVLLGSIHDGNRVDVNQGTLAQRLDSYQPTISASLRRLVDCGVLIRTDGVAGRFTAYEVSPRIAWFGADNGPHAEAVKRSPELRAPVRIPRNRPSPSTTESPAAPPSASHRADSPPAKPSAADLAATVPGVQLAAALPAAYVRPSHAPGCNCSMCRPAIEAKR